MRKSQVLLITVFAIILTSGIILILLFPVLSNLRALRETTYSYQALASAEAGLELELLNQQVKEDIFNNISGDPRREHSRQLHEVGGSFYKTGKTIDFRMGDINFDLYIATKTKNGDVYLRIEAIGTQRNHSRVLFLENHLYKAY